MTNSMEQTNNVDGWYFVCKICGKDHEVPEELAPYWKDSQTFSGIRQDVTLGCSESSEQTSQYSSAEFKPFRLS
jgi:hypothetical protein